MTKGYVCVECGSQIVGHSKKECDEGKTDMLFENWWNEDGCYIDPDTADVPWFDKRKELAALAYTAGRMSVPKWTPFVGQPVPQPERGEQADLKSQLEKMLETQADLDAQLEESRLYAQHLRVQRDELRSLLQRAYRLPRPWIDGDITWKEWEEICSAIEKAVAK